ncbi:hypothetical protein J4448_04745 [Candidatus Woesearchaeota archaeon]|nr:hypothetical protein [Candidatus Woesearchaeota archaeon]
MFWNKSDVEYLEDNYSSSNDKVLAEYLHKSQNSIRIKASRLNLKKNSHIYRNNLQLNPEEEQIIIGGLMGDLHCRIARTSKYARLEGGHGFNQKDYLIYKINLLQRLKWTTRKSKQGILYQSRSFPCLNYYYHLFYKNNKKIVNSSILEKLDKLGLLIWYMDDGTYHKRDRRAFLHTNCFSYDEQLIIQKYFEEKWGIYTKVYISQGKNKYNGKVWYYISFPTEETKKLHKLFNSYDIPECMKYKFNFTYQSHLPNSIPGVLATHN